MARKIDTSKSEGPAKLSANNDAAQDETARKDKPLMKAAKTVLNDPLVHSLVSGMVISAARKQGTKNGLGNSVIAFAATRVARKSLPGALLLGAGFLAKNWYDVRKARPAKAGQAQKSDASAHGLPEQGSSIADTLADKADPENSKKSGLKPPRKS
jgi:hypothetical protein